MHKEICEHEPMGQLMFTRTPRHCAKCGEKY